MSRHLSTIRVVPRPKGRLCAVSLARLTHASSDAERARTPGLGRREQRKADRKHDRALEQRTRASGIAPPGDWQCAGAPGAQREALARTSGPSQPTRAVPLDPTRSSSIMQDAREVAARRKRQLDSNRPPRTSRVMSTHAVAHPALPSRGPLRVAGALVATAAAVGLFSLMAIAALIGVGLNAPSDTFETFGVSALAGAKSRRSI